MAYTPPPGPARGTPPLPPSHLAPKYVPPPSATTTKVQYVTTQNPFGYHSDVSHPGSPYAPPVGVVVKQGPSPVPSPHVPLSQQGVAYRPPMGKAPPPHYHPSRAPYNDPRR